MQKENSTLVTFLEINLRWYRNIHCLKFEGSSGPTSSNICVLAREKTLKMVKIKFLKCQTLYSNFLQNLPNPFTSIYITKNMMLKVLQDEVDNDVEKIVHIQENYYYDLKYI